MFFNSFSKHAFLQCKPIASEKNTREVTGGKVLFFTICINS